jgi:signal recognition particle receptor subunit alpha
LTYIPALLQRTKQLFLALFQPYLETLVDALNDRAGTITAGSISALRILGDKIANERWERIFERCLKNHEMTGGKKGGRTIVQRLASGVDQSGASCECYVYPRSKD